MIAFPESEGGWQPVQPVSDKPQGRVWLVRRDGPGGERWGFFKYAGPEHRYFAGPMVANEWLAAQLLRRLGLPAAEVVPARVDGMEGVVSLARVPLARARRWRDLPLRVRRRHLRTFVRPSRLYGMVVFDVWTTNIDRGSGKNIVVYRRPGERRYRFYLIDHALALHGSYHKWRHYGPWPGPRWRHPWRAYTVPRGLRPTWRRLAPWVRRVQALPAEELRALVRAVPPRHLAPEEAEFVERLLLVRQRELAEIIARGCRRR